MRPRDIIQFFNACIVQADGKPTITPKILLEAEGTYSRERLRALADEWFGLYPNLMHLVKLLRGAKEGFKIGDLPISSFEDNALSLLVSGQGLDRLDLQSMNLHANGNMTPENYRETIIQIFYKVGMVGLKNADETAVSWSDRLPRALRWVPAGQRAILPCSPYNSYFILRVECLFRYKISIIKVIII